MHIHWPIILFDLAAFSIFLAAIVLGGLALSALMGE